MKTPLIKYYIMKNLLILIITCILTACSNEQQVSYSVIPLPQEISLNQNQPFRLNDKVVVAYPENNPLLERNARFLSEYVSHSTGYTLKLKTLSHQEKNIENTIILALNPEIDNKEGYIISVTPKNIRIEGQTENGVFYGIHT